MKHFFDTEFVENGTGHPISLISIALVAEDGREFYAQNVNSYPDNDFVTNHVWPYLDNIEYWHHRTGDADPWQTEEGIARGVRAFVGFDPIVEFWGYFCDYDYVVLSQLMGGMNGWPNFWPYYAHDLRQALDYEDLSHVTQPENSAHHALLDARWIRDAWKEHLARRRMAA